MSHHCLFKAQFLFQLCFLLRRRNAMSPSRFYQYCHCLPTLRHVLPSSHPLPLLWDTQPCALQQPACFVWSPPYGEFALASAKISPAPQRLLLESTMTGELKVSRLVASPQQILVLGRENQLSWPRPWLSSRTTTSTSCWHALWEGHMGWKTELWVWAACRSHKAEACSFPAGAAPTRALWVLVPM